MNRNDVSFIEYDPTFRGATRDDGSSIESIQMQRGKGLIKAKTHMANLVYPSQNT